MLFDFSFFLPLAFVPLFLLFDKSKEIKMLTVVSFAIITINWFILSVNSLLNLNLFETKEGLITGLFRGFQSLNDVMLYGTTFGLVVFCHFILGGTDLVKKTNPAKTLMSFFLLSCVLFTNNLLVALVAIETLLWINALTLYDESIVEVKWRRFYGMNHVATYTLLVFTLFVGLLEKSVTGSATYNFDLTGDFTISYVAETLYSTQTVLFLLSLTYLLIRTCLIKDLIASLYSKSDGVALGAMFSLLSVASGYMVYLSLHQSLFTMVYNDWGRIIYAGGGLFVLLFISLLTKFIYKKEALTWKN